MRAIIQRVKYAEVTIEGKKTEKIKNGLLVFLAIAKDDNEEDIIWLSKKICSLRIFYDGDGVKNISVKDIDGDILVISNFTLFARVKKGNRPSYIDAADPEVSIPLYKKFISQIENDLGKPIKKGKFAAYMQIELLNDGPVTINIDTKNKH